ncbi:hypothetical protein EHE19_008680 [Ruminiclostridium herbifermentans]|uniref:Cas10/Cmr2 second palm domain-containing protein n=1 Tax=Ruminiclostridium herbifermentans TaxID=2488810 RepID=A0A4U7JN97_9FIRM|nr:hypothetical protein [Ruminiclostridium herbifermentans]QNU68455.1 hypothetical protein EHE19_008680 [Ruminiclostridium herbifermentans]
MIEYLVVSEVSQKQNYIFKSNKLKENIGASINIRKITESLPDDIQKELKCSMEKIFAGGGKNIYCFSKLEEAKNFVYKYSFEILENYHGVEIFMAVQEYDKEKEFIFDAIQRLYQKLEEKKRARKASYRLYGLGINEICTSSLMPANDSINDDGKKRLISNETYEKLNAVNYIDKELKAVDGTEITDFKELMPDNFSDYRFPREFNKLGGKKDEKRYIAVVVVDGNGMGKKLEKFQRIFNDTEDTPSEQFNEKYKKEYLDFSNKIDSLYKDALKSTIQLLGESIPKLMKRDDYKIEDKVMPFRPLIQAGDDVCYVMDARIAIDFTYQLLSYINEHQIQFNACGVRSTMKMSACAGIAIVKEGYPFFKAHQLAESLCNNAKANINGSDICCLDFHIAQGEISGDIQNIRQKNYKTKSCYLTNKPFEISDFSSNKLIQLYDFISKLKNSDIGRRNILDLRTELRKGREATEEFLRNRQLRKTLKLEECYEENRCIALDAIEALDFFWKLGEENGGGL